MITVLRNSLKDGGMTTIIWIAVGSMIIGSALPLVMKKSGGEGWAIRVNGTEVPYTVYAAELAMVRDYVTMLRTQYGQFAEYILQNMGFTDPQSATVQQLINQQLMAYGYTVQGIAVGQASIDYKLHNQQFVENSCADLLPAFVYKDNVLDAQMLKLYLQRRGLTMEQLQQRLTDRIGASFLQQILQHAAYVPAATLTDAVQQTHSLKDIAVVRMSLDARKKQHAQTVTDEELRAFFEQENARAQRYYIPEHRTGTCWKFDRKGYDITFDNAALEAYYTEHKNTRYIKEAATVDVRALSFSDRAEAEMVRAKIVQGEAPFASFAQEYPFDADAAANGGLLKTITRGAGDRVIERAAFVLMQDGDVSPVIEHGNTYILIQRVHKTAPVFTPFSAVRDEISKQLNESRFKEQCMHELQALAHTAQADEIQAFAQLHKAEKTTLRASLTDARSTTERALFTLEKGGYTALNQGSECVLVRLDTVDPVQKQSFEAVQKQVKEDLIETKAHADIAAQFTSFKQTIVQKGFADAAHEYGLTIDHYKGVGGSDTDMLAKLRKQGIEITPLNRLERVGTLTTAEQQGDVIILFLEGIHQGAAQELEDATKLRAQRTTQTQETVVSGYIASLYRDAKIERNDILALLEEDNTI